MVLLTRVIAALDALRVGTFLGVTGGGGFGPATDVSFGLIAGVRWLSGFMVEGPAPPSEDATTGGCSPGSIG